MFGSAPGRAPAPAALSPADYARRVFQTKHNLSLVPSAIQWLEELCAEFNLEQESDIVDTFEHLVKGVQGHGSGLDGPVKITAQVLDEAYQRLRVSADQPNTENGHGDDFDTSQYLKVVDAFDMPAWRWGEESKTFERAPKGPSLAPPPSSKARYLRDRYHIIRQVILRNEHFSPPAIAGNERSDYMKLTSIKNLLGRQGNHFLIFGLLARMEDGAFYLEDLDDKVELDLSEATPESGLFTEGSFVLVDGDYMADSTFRVNEMGHPPSERRKDAMFVVFFSSRIVVQAELVAAEQSPQHETSFVVLSDLHLDNYKTMNALREMLETYEGVEDEHKPSLFVLCGNFRSRPFLFDGESTREYNELFNNLATLLSSFPSLLHHSRFLLIPGPTDPYASLTLPRPALPDSLTKSLSTKIPNITFGSNPCRVRYFSQELVFFREDLMGRMMRNAVRMGDGSEQKGTDLRKALVQTILDQAHLAPLPLNVRPVLWDFDHALRLYPMPTTLILADKFDPYKLVYEDCLVFNPGSFARRKYSWSTYHPHMVEPKERMEESELPDE
ncbi:DNA polymerase epsilon subunit 2 [Pseudohyphozyma bogoriensis]|nr:DNA polymerase epsilon subunit 2 [Pseudohyphozyma bogoriensis]